MSILLALTSAVVYGVADYCGGRASRVYASALVTLIGQTVTLAILLGIVLAAGTPVPGASTFAWGAFGGVAGAVGLVSLYHSFANGAMTVVAPLSAVTGAVVPLVVGLADGERPGATAYVGIALALAAVALVLVALGRA